MEFNARRATDSVTNLYFNTDGTPNGVQSGSVVYRIQVTLADGSTHEMRRDDTPVQVDYYHPENPAGTYYSVDGSHMRLEYHTGANAPPNVLYLANGSRYIFDQDSNGYALISSIDRNGNKLVYSRNQNGQYQWTDTLGRTFGLLLPSNPTSARWWPSPLLLDTGADALVRTTAYGPLRAEYGAFKRGGSDYFVSVDFGKAKVDRAGIIVRNKAGGIEVNKTNKTISWVKRTVGGTGIN